MSTAAVATADTGGPNGSVAGHRLPHWRTVRVSPSEPPRLFVVIDTEEEFDWSGPRSRENTSVTAIRHVDRIQSLFDRYGISPTYVIDYPVATKPEAYTVLQEFSTQGRCSIGAHLHPWVNPPFDEKISSANSYLCNLPFALQRDKLARLVEAIRTNLGVQPRAFKAGRYGLGPSTVPLLEQFGFRVDNSVDATRDFSDDGGPTFAGVPPQPFLLTPRLLELPCTGEYAGWAGRWREPLHRAALAARPLRLVGALARLGAVNHLRLSPEGHTFAEMRALTRYLLARGYRTFTMTLHSPSVEPGHTPYVRTASELDQFLARIDRFFACFVGELRGIPSTLEDFFQRVATTPEWTA